MCKNMWKLIVVLTISKQFPSSNGTGCPYGYNNLHHEDNLDPHYQDVLNPRYKRSLTNLVPDLTLPLSDLPNSAQLLHNKCSSTKYRTIDGSCNNLKNPLWGTPNGPYTRLLPAQYGDAISSPTVSQCDSKLPLPRLVTLVMFPEEPIEDPEFTLAAMQYGQMVAHDLSLIAANINETYCCTDDGNVVNTDNPKCYPIILPPNDPTNLETNKTCLNFIRSRTTDPEDGPVEQLTIVNNYLDLSIVYGNNDALADTLRQFQNGRMRVDQRYSQQWLPRAVNASTTCVIDTPEEICYIAGDTRVNQHAQLALLHIVLLREHNRVAGILQQLNPHWDDEKLFQETRRICIAQHQQIAYYEWLPIIVGSDIAHKKRLIYRIKGHVDDYRDDVNPTIINEYANAAGRYFHSAIAGRLDLVSEDRHTLSSLHFSDWLFKPKILELKQGTNFVDLGRGLMTQPEMFNDEFHDTEMSKFVLKNDKVIANDLKTMDVQRNRDHGLASYNDMREYCGLPKAATFEDFHDLISVKNVRKLKQLYACPDDVDLTVGATLEPHVNGTLVGPTNLCILTRQFYKTRVSDRFWFEHSQNNNGFSLKQLKELRKASIARFMCDNAGFLSMQPRGFQRISKKNKLVHCNRLPQVDLTLWKERKVESSVSNSSSKSDSSSLSSSSSSTSSSSSSSSRCS